MNGVIALMIRLPINGAMTMNQKRENYAKALTAEYMSASIP